MQKQGDHCPDCGGNDWFPIPDSLAQACEGCGYVRVRSGNNWKRRASLREWAKDLYEAGKKKEEA